MADESAPDARDGDQQSLLTQLEADLAGAREEARETHDKWLRERADLENLKRRAAREREEAVKFGNERLLRDLLPIVDNLERALGAAQAGGDTRPVIDGVALVLKALDETLARHGVTRVETQGAAFDPAHHEAVAHVESEQHAPSTVIEEHQRGYRFHDRLLRPALVTVAKGRPGDDDLANQKPGD